MTTLAAIQGQGWCVIGADSLIADDTRIYILNKNAGKLFKSDGYIFAIAGDVRPFQIIQHSTNFPSIPKVDDTSELDKFISLEVIPTIREALKAEDYTLDKEANFTFLVAIKGVIYIIDQDLCWTRDKRGLYAEGSGGDYALGAMNAWQYPETIEAAKEVVRKSIGIAAQYDINTREPISILVQENK